MFLRKVGEYGPKFSNIWKHLQVTQLLMGPTIFNQVDVVLLSNLKNLSEKDN